MDREKMIKDNINLVYYMVHKGNYSLPSVIEKKDLVGFGMEGLIQAADTYKEGCGMKFSSWAATKIGYKIIDRLRQIETRVADMPEVLSLDNDGGQNFTFHETVGDKGNVYKSIEAKDIAEKILTKFKMDDRERRVLTEYFYEDKPYHKIGDGLGLTTSRVAQIMSGVLRRMRKEYKNN
jgi:RNA polymerase sigma factor (sigma-70 family)